MTTREVSQHAANPSELRPVGWATPGFLDACFNRSADKHARHADGSAFDVDELHAVATRVLAAL